MHMQQRREPDAFCCDWYEGNTLPRQMRNSHASFSLCRHHNESAGSFGKTSDSHTQQSVDLSAKEGIRLSSNDFPQRFVRRRGLSSPTCTMERIMSRPHSPFKRSSRPPSRSGSPVRGLSASVRWAAGEQQSMPSAPSAAFAGPSSSPDESLVDGTGLERSSSALTRVEQYDVVVEGHHGEAILSHLGALVLDHAGSLDENQGPPFVSSSNEGGQDRIGSLASPRKQNPGSMADGSAEKYDALLHELLQTEKSYVHRIEVLYQRYAIPLRQMARDRDTAIIPLYEAQRLFGNIGEIVGANMTFLRELEQYVSDRCKGKFRQGGGTELGDIIYRNIACFSCYNEYFNNFEKAKHIEQTMMRSNKSFRDFVERTKYSTAGLGNVGLRELIMEPVQRIPRYTLFFNGLVRNLPNADPNKSRLEQAIVLAGRIASCEVDDKTKRAAVLWSLSRSMEGFPAGLISVRRQYIDCIDVDDFPIDVLGPAAMNTLLSPGGANPSQGYRTLHCTLFLFDDVIAVAKRASSSSCGRTLVGLDNLNKLADQMKTYTERSAVLKSPPKVELGFRGLIDISDVRAVDMGGPDFQLLFKRPPTHINGDKWAGRPVRQYATVDAHSDQGPDPAVARGEKQRFLFNLWRSQALFKTREHRSHVRTMIIPSSDKRTQRVVYWNVFSRHAYLMEPNKSDVVLHVDPEGEADDLPFGHDETPAHASVRILSLDDSTAFCTYVATFKSGMEVDVTDAGEVHHVPLASLADELHRTNKGAQRFGSDFDPRQGSPSPKSPSSSHRGKALASGLEQFGRSLFGTPSSLRSNTTGSDFWGGVRRQRSKGSSQFSRNASTSTRQTNSTAQTSSIGSRDMMGRMQFGASTSGELQASIERYRNVSPGLDSTATPTRQRTLSQSPSARDGSVSPIRRKPVPSSSDERHSSPQRVVSASKRELPLDATPTQKPSKRAARTPQGSGGDSGSDAEASSSESPPSPSPQTPRRNDSGRSGHSSIVAPLSIRKDKGQPRTKSREETMRMVLRDLDVLERANEASRKAVERAKERMEAELLDDCLMDLESTQEALRRLQAAIANLTNKTDDLQSSEAAAAAAAMLANNKKSPIKLQTQMETLTRKCELLASLERDGRLENTELHKAFNEELDRMYDDAQLAEVEQIARLRAEVRHAKSQRNEAYVERKSLQRQLALEKAQSDVYYATLKKHGLI